MARQVLKQVTKKSNFTIFFGLFLVSMLFVPPAMPSMIPEAEAQAAAEITTTIDSFYLYYDPDTERHRYQASGQIIFDFECDQQYGSGTCRTGVDVETIRPDGIVAYPLSEVSTGTVWDSGNRLVAPEIIQADGTWTLKACGFLSLTASPSGEVTKEYGTCVEQNFTIDVGDATPITINTIEFYPETTSGYPSDYVRFHVTGTAAPGEFIHFYYMFPDVAGGGDGPLDLRNADANGYFDESQNIDGLPILMFDYHGITEHTLAICTTGFTNASGNCVYQNFTWPPPDTTPPVISLCIAYGCTEDSITRQAINSTGYNVTYQVRGTDDVAMPNGNLAERIDGIVWQQPQGSGNCSPAPGSLFPVGVTTVTCSAADAAGNVGTLSFTVTVLAPAETPTLTATAYLNSTSGGTGKTIQLSKTDLLSIIENYPDVSNNQWHFAVKIIKDDIVLISNWEFNWYTVNYTALQLPIPVDWEAGTYQLSWESDYVCSNCPYLTGTSSFNIPALDTDTTPPVITLVCCAMSGDTTDNITRQATNSTGYNVNFTVVTNDAGDGWDNEPYTEDLVSCSTAPNSLFPIGTTTVTCTATDSAGNVGTAIFTVTVLAPAGTPTLTITAYLNSTSTTGRTISAEVSGWDDPAFANCQDDWCTMSVQVGIYKDGIKATFGDNVWHETLYTEGWPYANFAGHGSSTQIPIPADWEAGTYDIVWNNCGNYWEGFDSCSNADNKYTQGSTTVTIPALSGAEEEEIVIPSWIKNNAGWWADGQIDDRAFVSGLQWLITNGIMNIPPTEQGAGSDDVIPSWIKNNAGWWAEDLIDDRNFVTGLQWLITNGIMIIELE